MQGDIERTATQNALRAAVTISADAVFANRDAASIECGKISVSHASSLPEDSPTRSRRSLHEAAGAGEHEGLEHSDHQNHHHLRRHVSAGSAIVLSGGVALLLTVAIVAYIRRLRAPLSKVSETPTPSIFILVSKGSPGLSLALKPSS